MLNVLAWNINARTRTHSSYGHNWPFVISELEELLPDIFCLTEFPQGIDARFLEFLQFNGYRWWVARGKNWTLVAVKDSLADAGAPVSVRELPDAQTVIVTVQVDNKPLSILGTRVPVGPSSKQEFDERNEHMQELANEIAALPGEWMLMGDFNCARVLNPNAIEDHDQRTLTHDEIQEEFGGYAQINHNIFTIRNHMIALGGQLHVPAGDKGSFYLHKINFKLDLCGASSGLRVTNCEYRGEFIGPQRQHKDTAPDHNQLVFQVQL